MIDNIFPVYYSGRCKLFVRGGFRMKKNVLGFLLLTLLTVFVAGCNAEEENNTIEPVSQNEQTKTTTGTVTDEAANKDEVKPTGNVVDVSISAKNFEFDVKEIKANVGDTVKLTVVNDAGSHGIAIDAFNVNVRGGETAEFVVNKTGEFDYYCSIMCGTGHDTMQGKLIVK